MKKENFVSLILGTVGGILFALGMCMCLVAEWNAARPGVVLAIVGALALGVGMCMTMVWSMMIPGIIVGIIGIVALLCLIPVVKGLK